MFAPVGDNHLLRFIGQSVITVQLLGDRLAQGRFPSRRAIASFALIQSLLGCRHHMGRSWEVWLPGAEATDIQTARFHGLRLGSDGERDGGGDLSDPRR